MCSGSRRRPREWRQQREREVKRRENEGSERDAEKTLGSPAETD